MDRTGLLELNAVVAVANRRSFRAAALELGLSPSAVSHAIAALEQRMGVRLFNRTTRSVALSEAGEGFLARLRPALGEIAAAMEAVNEFRDRPRGTLRINASSMAAQYHLMPHILDFLRLYPEMQVDVVTEGRFVDIVAQGFDAGVRLAEAVPQDMIAVPLSGDQRLVVVCSPDFLATVRPPEAPEDLLRHNCIRRRMPSGSLYRWEFEKRGLQLALDVRGNLTLDEGRLMVDAALAGVGFAMVNQSAVEDVLADGRLVAVLDDWTPAFPGNRLYYPGHRHAPAGLRALVALIRANTQSRMPRPLPSPSQSS
ncbi:LysR family transcriptional regulator [Zavarzinia sp.]|uniref:LysR family transcriptional regulator n=1 Tax=Zavarzinia sp. TaxID=2027920 RepID=UPI0035668C50